MLQDLADFLRRKLDWFSGRCFACRLSHGHEANACGCNRYQQSSCGGVHHSRVMGTTARSVTPFWVRSKYNSQSPAMCSSMPVTVKRPSVLVMTLGRVVMP